LDQILAAAEVGHHKIFLVLQMALLVLLVKETLEALHLLLYLHQVAVGQEVVVVTEAVITVYQVAMVVTTQPG
jgi:hypothetical protein